ncbi:MAG: hypothetical protein IJO88_05895, partial [Oscillospiraceae bacterium]|nr:hypothetical protein [Oscillospiraceae bacterium]
PLCSANPLQIWIPILGILWAVGVAVFVLYAAVSYWRLQRNVREAVILRDNIFQSENVGSPFVLGIIKPKIYLPYHMDEQSLDHVVAHEQAHIRRKDHWWKPLGFLLLAIHWFNPLMWLSYVLLCRDIELACDESVIKELDNEHKADYTQALLHCSIGRRRIAACPLAFGEVGVKERVRSVMNYKKPAFWIIAVSIAVCAAVAVCFLTGPAGETPEHEDSYHLVIGADGVTSIQISGADTGGGIVHADGSAFRKGEKVWLEPLEGVTDLRGISITAFGADGAILYLLSVPEDLPDTEVLDLIGSDSWLLVPEGLLHTGKTYVYENEGFMGTFAITLYQDGTFQYYEGMASSYLGNGTWEQNGDIITLTDDELNAMSLVNRFRVDGEDLVFVAEGSSNFIYVKVKDGDRFHYTQGQISPMIVGSTTQKSTLTLEDVLALSEKGMALTWRDFEDFAYVETGSGLYIRVYEIDEMYQLRIGGSSPNHAPMYIYLSLLNAPDTMIDIRHGDVAGFLAADHSDVLLTQAIYDAILEHNSSSGPDELYHCASFVLLDKQELCICSDPPSPMQVIVYGMALHQAYRFTETGLWDEQGSHIPVALTFEVENGVYALLEYWEPRDGSYYVQDIREKFPDAVENDAMDTQKYIVSQIQNCYDQAVRYGGVDTDAVIEGLLEAVAASPAYASSPGAHTDAQPIEYRELIYYGKYTLQYCFAQFLQRDRTDLQGHIMASVCQDIMLGWGEGYAIDGTLATGQDWFDAFRGSAESLAAQYSDAELEARFPGAHLLIQMQPLCGYPPATVDETAFVLPESSAKSTAPSDGFGISAPEDWVGSDRTLIQDKDTDPGLSLPADGGSMPKLRIAPVP